MINVYYHPKYRYFYYDLTANKLSIHVDSPFDLPTARLQPAYLPSGEQLRNISPHTPTPLFVISSIDELLPYLKSHPELLL